MTTPRILTAAALVLSALTALLAAGSCGTDPHPACTTLSRLPAYSYEVDNGSRIYVPAGWRHATKLEASSLSTEDRDRECKELVAKYEERTGETA